MERIRQTSLMVVLVAICFAGAFALRVRGHSSGAQDMASGETPDVAELKSLGVRSGRELVAYVFVSSHCGYCQQADTKNAVANVRKLLAKRHGVAFRGVKVVGIAVDGDEEEGIEYLRTIGLKNFDEISVGAGWRNEQITRLIWRDKVAEAEVPQVVLVTHVMTSTLSPLVLSYGTDSVVSVVRGSKALVEWVKAGVPLNQTMVNTALRDSRARKEVPTVAAVGTPRG